MFCPIFPGAGSGGAATGDRHEPHEPRRSPEVQLQLLCATLTLSGMGRCNGVGQAWGLAYYHQSAYFDFTVESNDVSIMNGDEGRVEEEFM